MLGNSYSRKVIWKNIYYPLIRLTPEKKNIQITKQVFDSDHEKVQEWNLYDFKNLYYLNACPFTSGQIPLENLNDILAPDNKVDIIKNNWRFIETAIRHKVKVDELILNSQNLIKVLRAQN